ncbi:MAG TPA: alpha/beta hydrolase [Kofleriaceae bacterium]|nr:alpha/beta hydrolase [Kofleriaceae bacterium]
MTKTFELETGTLHALELGAGKPLLFLHGFPDHPPTAQRFFDELASRGFRVLAPWLPGYAPSPTDGPMTTSRVARDLLALLESWSPGAPVDIVGHDWGAVMTYVLCASAPDRFHRAVTMAVPHPRTFARQLRTAKQLRASWYMAFFQLPGSARVTAARDFALVDRLWRTWSPTFALPDDQRAALHACLAQSMPAPLRWYRAAARDRSGMQLFRSPITTPLLYLHGADDGCIVPPTVDDSRRFTEYERAVLEDLGHFLHLEDPAGVAERVATWLAH